MLKAYLEKAITDDASDIFIVAGLPLSFKIGGAIIPRSEERLTPAQTAELVKELYALGKRDMTVYSERGDDDFPVSVPGWTGGGVTFPPSSVSGVAPLLAFQVAVTVTFLAGMIKVVVALFASLKSTLSSVVQPVKL